MNKNIIIVAVIIAVIVVLGGGYMLFRGQTNQQTNATPSETTKPSNQEVTPTEKSKEEEASAATIEYTDEGFKPSTVTIKSGDSVTWINNRSSQMWVASSPHPAHTDYPGFDALKGMNEGESYTFTFTEPGTWKYHNHLSPSVFGEVVVE